MKSLSVPAGMLAAGEDAAARQRALLAERLRLGEDVVVSPTGELEEPDPDDDTLKLKPPKGELA